MVQPDKHAAAAPAAEEANSTSSPQLQAGMHGSPQAVSDSPKAANSTAPDNSVMSESDAASVTPGAELAPQEQQAAGMEQQAEPVHETGSAKV